MAILYTLYFVFVNIQFSKKRECKSDLPVDIPFFIQKREGKVGKMLNYYDTVFGDGVIHPAAGCASSGGLLCFFSRPEGSDGRPQGWARDR